MPLTPSTIGDNPQIPGATAQVYVPDQLIAGPLNLITDTGTLGAGVLARGTILGQQTVGAATATSGKPAGGANIGTATISAITLAAGAQAGAYLITALTATTYSVIAPDGTRLADATAGAAYSDQIGFTITTGGTAMVAGDGFTVTAAVGSGNYVESVKTATDGSQVPNAILINRTADASGGPVKVGVYLMGEFNQNAIVFDASWTLAALKAALRPYSIFLKSSVSAADPT